MPKCRNYLWRFSTYAWLIAVVVWCGLPRKTAAQVPGPAPIRVESDDVLVPVWVFDKGRYDELFRADEGELFTDLFSRNYGPWEDVYIRGLPGKDFHLFEDGIEQKIQSVIVRVPHILRVSDNFGEHYQFVGSGGGRWTFPDNPTPYQALNFDVLQHWPSYIIAYDPPPSRSENCHHVAVGVSRADSLVYAQQRYCRNALDASDPLAGTALDRQMEAELKRKKGAQIRLLLAVFPSLSTAATSRVDIVLEFPWRDLKYTLAHRTLYETVGVLGSITSTGGKEIARFTDVEGHNTRDDLTTDILMGSGPPLAGPSAILNMPRRYDRQVYLPPGQYKLRIVLTDDKHFGYAEATFKVDDLSSKHLALSGIAIARRFQSSELWHQDSNSGAGDQPALVSQEIDSMPTADNRFARDSTLHCYFEVYGSSQQGSPQKSLKVQLRILNAKNGSVARQFKTVAAEQYAMPNNPIISVAQAINIKGLPKGRYQLEAQAADSGDATISRSSVNLVIGGTVRR